MQVHGMEGLSLLLTLPIRFDIIKGVMPYYMHGILLVGVKKSLFFWFYHSDYEQYY